MTIAAGFELEAAGTPPAGSLPGASLALLGLKTGKAAIPNTQGGPSQAGRAESFKSSWQSMLESLTAGPKDLEYEAPVVEETGAATAPPGSGKSAAGVAYSKSEIEAEPVQRRLDRSSAALAAGKGSATVNEPVSRLGTPNGSGMIQNKTVNTSYRSEWSRHSEASKAREESQDAPDTVAANPAEPTGLPAVLVAVANAVQGPTLPPGLRDGDFPEENSDSSQLTLPAPTPGLRGSEWAVPAGTNAPQFTELAGGLTSQSKSSATQANHVQQNGADEIRATYAAATTQQAAPQQSKQPAGEQSAQAKAVPVFEGRESGAAHTNPTQPVMEPPASEQAPPASGQTASVSAQALPTSEQAMHEASIQTSAAQPWMSAGFVQGFGPGVADGVAIPIQKPQATDENSPTELWKVSSSKPLAERQSGEANVARATHGSGGAAASGLTSAGNSPGVQADASILAHDPSGTHGAGSVMNQGNPQSGAGSGLPGSAGGSTAQQAFAALDGESGAKPSWVHAGSHSAEAGFVDPALGWVGVRADLGAGTVHASVLPGSTEAAQTLGGHMAGLNAYLSRETNGVETVTLASPEGRDTNAGGGGMQLGTGDGAGQGDGQRNSFESPSSAQQFAASDAARATQENSAARIGFDQVVSAGQPGGHISVIV